MRTQLLTVIAAAATLACPSSAWAQRMPHKGSGAVGGDVGMFIPQESSMSIGPAVEGFFEHYLSARESVRVDVGWMSPSFDGPGDDSLRHVRLGGSLLHNWEGGAVHPFVGAGLGLYFLQERSSGASVGDSRTRLGGVLMGGIEYFTSKTFAVKGEAAYHIVGKIDDFNPSGLLLSIGGKVYF